MENKYKIKICKGCDHLSIVPLLKTNIACCPDSNYVDVEFCSPNERKFLDEIKSGCKSIDEDGDIIFSPKHSFETTMIFQEHFDSDLSEIVKL